MDAPALTDNGPVDPARALPPVLDPLAAAAPEASATGAFFVPDSWINCGPCLPGVTGDNFTVDPATNRLTAKNGFAMTYDAAGNQTNDATGNRWYDGENRMKQAQQGAANSYYVYDADGRRVRRIVGGVETWMVYGMEGELLAEYPANGAVGSPQEVCPSRNPRTRGPHLLA